MAKPTPDVFQLTSINQTRSLFRPVKMVMTCIASTQEPDPSDYYTSFHDCSWVYAQSKIGQDDLGTTYIRTWRMIRCEVPPTLQRGSDITVYFRPRSPLPWNLWIRELLYRISVVFGQLLALLRGGTPRDGVGTGGGPAVGTVTRVGATHAAPGYHDSETIIIRPAE